MRERGFPMRRDSDCRALRRDPSEAGNPRRYGYDLKCNEEQSDRGIPLRSWVVPLNRVRDIHKRYDIKQVPEKKRGRLGVVERVPVFVGEVHKGELEEGKGSER